MYKISLSYFSKPGNNYICWIQNTCLKDDFQSTKTKKNRKRANNEKQKGLRNKSNWIIKPFSNSNSLLSTSKQKLEASSIFLYTIYRISSYAESNSSFQIHEKHSTSSRDFNLLIIKLHFEFNFDHIRKISNFTNYFNTLILKAKLGSISVLMTKESNFIHTGVILVPCSRMEMRPYSYFRWCGYFWGPWVSFVTADEFSVRVTNITSRIGVSWTHSLPF